MASLQAAGVNCAVCLDETEQSQLLPPYSEQSHCDSLLLALVGSCCCCRLETRRHATSAGQRHAHEVPAHPAVVSARCPYNINTSAVDLRPEKPLSSLLSLFLLLLLLPLTYLYTTFVRQLQHENLDSV